MSASNDGADKTQRVTVSEPRHTLEDLKPGSLVKVRIRGNNSAGAGPFAPWSWVLTRKSDAPDIAVLAPAGAGEEEPHLPSVVYHYTRAGGLIGIVKNASIWATMLPYLNDDQEYLYIYRLAVNYLDRLAAFKGWVSKYPALAAAIQRQLAQADAPLPLGGPAHRFVVSFSTLEDDLSQWRSYGRPGEGYALGFDPRWFGNLAGWQFLRCTYGEEPVGDLVQEAMHSMFRRFNAGEFESEEAAVRDLRAALAVHAPTAKHQSFSAENEWRLVSPPINVLDGDPLVEYREGLGTLIPYIQVSLSLAGDPETPPALVKLIVGPGPSMESAALSALGLMATRGIHVAVSTSDAPYRAV